MYPTALTFIMIQRGVFMGDINERQIIMNSYLSIIDFLAQTYGKSCEIVLHSVDDGKISIVAIKNGEISKRKVGKDLSLIGKKMQEHHEKTGYRVNHHETSLDGKEIKANTYYIKDSSGELIGMLCINFDLTIPNTAKKFLEEFMGSSKSTVSHTDKVASDSIKDLTIKMIEEIIRESGIPADRMTVEEKKEILKSLKEKEVFRTKGAIRIVAKYLNSSETSIYRYFKEIE